MLRLSSSVRRRAGALAVAADVVAPLLAATAALSAATPAEAAAATDSIVYLKDGRVWIAQADGSGAHAFTKAAYNWASPSEDSLGDVVVAGGLARVNPDGYSESSGSSEIYRFAPNGNQIGSAIPTWGSYSTTSCPTYGPLSVRVSPDGSKIAYAITKCSASYTTMWVPSTSTALYFPNQSAGMEDFYEPSWVDSSSFLVSHVGPVFLDSDLRWIVHATADPDGYGYGWNDPNVTGTGAQAVMRVLPSGAVTTVIFEDDAANWPDGVARELRLWIYSADSLATAEAGNSTAECTVTLDPTKTSDPVDLSPSISTDGTKVYWGDDTGVEVAQISDLSNSCANVVPTLLIPGASRPFVSNGGVGTLLAEPRQPGVQYPPHPKFRVTTAHPHVGRRTGFDASASYETLGRIVRYVWHFGDRTASAKGVKVRHVFKKRGIFTVKLTVTDRRGVRRSVSHKVRVTRA